MTLGHSFRLDVPRFDGTDPMGWLFKINQFFDFHQTPLEHRITIASFYLDGEALAWFQWMHANQQLSSWPQFIMVVQARFAPSTYEDPGGALFKLRQTGSVRSYQAEFDTLANRVHGLPPHFFLSCFISGLKPEIRREVQALLPTSLPQAIGLAQLQEDKLRDATMAQRRSVLVTPTPDF